ncbi:MAG: COX15/CtaA family protein [Burkholderiaceae bacterium]|nr:COX15/CtaA family protein [Burkholderiaceae bacterium]
MTNIHEAASLPARGLRIYAWLLCAATLILLFLGGQVKSHEAGLSVPDWPLTYGENPVTFPLEKWVGGIFHEHFHRLVAGTVALMTAGMAALLWMARARPWMKWLGVAAVIAVLLQAVLGGLTVWWGLPDAVSSAHALLAQTFFLMTVLIAYGLSAEWSARSAHARTRPETRTPLHAAGIALVALLYVQLLLGALTRHTESALAIPDFPTSAGQWIPAFNDQTVEWVNQWRTAHSFETGVDLAPVALPQIALHFAHRVGAVVITLFVALLVWLAYRHEEAAPRGFPVACALVFLTGVQFMLGAMTVITGRMPILASAHLAVGAALLGTALLFVLRVWPLGATSAPSTASAEALRAGSA